MKYTIPGISTLIALIVWIGKKWLSKIFGQKMERLPWNWILICSIALLLGIVYADAFNDSSQLRSWITERSKIANIENFVLAGKGENEKSWYEAVIHLRFLSKLKDVSCTIEVTQYADLDHAKNSFVIRQEVIPNTERNLIKQIRVVTFPRRVSKKVPVGYPYWGDDKNQTWAGDGLHIVTLTLSSGLRQQSQKFLISAIKDVGDGPEPVILFGGPESQSYMQIR